MLKRYGRYLVAVGLGLAVLAVADIAVRIAIPSQPRQPNIAGYSRPERPFHSENTDPKDCEQRDAAPLNKTPRIANHALEETRKRDCRAYAKSEETLKYETLDYAARQANAAEEAVRSAYDQVRIAWWQTATTVGGFAVTVFAAFFAWRATVWAKKAAEYGEKSVKVAITSQRPWLHVSLNIGSAMAQNEHGLSMLFRVTIENKGSSPATNIRAHLRLAFATEVAEKTPGLWPKDGFALFPGDIDALTLRGNIDADEVAAALAATKIAHHLPAVVVVSVKYKFAGGDGLTKRLYYLRGPKVGDTFDIRSLPSSDFALEGVGGGEIAS